MIKITPPSKPDIIFPVVRRCSVTKSVWLFLTRYNAVCVDAGHSLYRTVGETEQSLDQSLDINDAGWIPVDLHITG